MKKIFMTKKINHKIIAIIIGTGLIFYIGICINNYINISKEIDVVQNQIESYKMQNNTISTTLNSIPGKLSPNTDLSYYAGSIYAYASLEDFKVETRNGETKYKDTIALNVYYSEFQDKNKFKDFIKSLSHLGYIENITNKSLVLHVTNFTIEDAIKLNNSNISNKE